MGLEMNIIDFPITQLSRLIENKKISPVEVVDAYLNEIDRLNPVLNAYITVCAEQAKEAAILSEEEIMKGRWQGCMHGIPVAHKDIISTRGIKTTANSELLKNWVPKKDATVVEKLDKAGAIMLGKLNLHEFAMQRPGVDVCFSPAKNPWNLAKSPGGSSSGSGAAISARLACGVTGTDTGGSIRHPASVTGTVGLKPTHGRVSLHGVLPLAVSLDHVGPMTRTVRDNALMLQVMSGFDEKDPWSSDRSQEDFSGLIGEKLNKCVAGVPWGVIQAGNHDEEVLACFDDALRLLRSLGVELKEIHLPSFDSSRFEMLLGLEALGHHRERLAMKPWGYSKGMRERLLGYERKENMLSVVEANQYRRLISVHLDNLFSNGVDIIVTPGRAVPADDLDPNVPLRTPSGAAYFLYNMSGVPALVIPSGFTKKGLPIGLQMAASRWRENLLYQVGAAFEDETSYWRRYPDGLSYL